jgi:hypothetical protein
MLNVSFHGFTRALSPPSSILDLPSSVFIRAHPPPSAFKKTPPDALNYTNLPAAASIQWKQLKINL